MPYKISINAMKMTMNYKHQYPLSIDSFLDFPEEGWVIDNQIIHPPNAYISKRDFINAVLTAVYPQKKNKVLSLFQGNALFINRLEERAVKILCDKLNQKQKESS